MKVTKQILSFCAIALLGFGSTFGSVVGVAWAAPKISAAKLKKDGIKVVKCPGYIANIRSGLASSVLKQNSICINSSKLGKSKKNIKRARLVLDGTDFWGVPFPPIVAQEGDVQTEPFEIGNYPAIVKYSVRQASSKSTFKISIVDSLTGKDIQTILRGTGGESQQLGGEFAINFPGRYFLRITASGEFLKDPDDREGGEEIQPIFSVSVTFMDRYEGFEIEAEDIKDAGLRKVACPAHIIDTQTGKMYPVGKKYFCSNSPGIAFEDAGFTIAPLNLGLTMFLATEVATSSSADHVWLPFRVLGPSPLEYSADDPSLGRGRLKMSLIELTTGARAARFVETKGNISSTTTSLNIPGDYYVFAEVDSFNREDSGELEFEYEVAPGF